MYVKKAIETLLHEGASSGCCMTALMILIFLGSFRATVAVCLSIPLSALATFLALSMGGGTLNTMVLGGLALVFSRVIDNSVVVLENIYPPPGEWASTDARGREGRAGSDAARSRGHA